VSNSQPPTPADRNPLAEASAAPHFTPFVPASSSPLELTVRGLVLGSVLGIIFAASSVYLAVKVGMTVSASIPIAVLAIAIFRAIGNGSILENTIVQTTGSAGESLAFGVSAALPALLFLGYNIDLGHAFLTALLGGVLGVLMMIPLRYGLIVKEHGKLTYPEGTACADVLMVGEAGGTNAKTVIAGFVVGGLYKFGYSALRLWHEVVGTALSWVGKSPTGETVAKGYVGGSVAMEVSPELLGVGYIIGPRVAGITFAGGVLSYLVLIPLITFFGAEATGTLGAPAGTPPIRELTPDGIRNAYVLYIGAGAVATGGLVSLLRSLPTIIGAFRRAMQTLKATSSGGTLVRTERDLPITYVLGGIVVLILMVWLMPPLQVNLTSALLIVVLGFFFVTVSARITGEIGSSSNPISGMVVATLLITCLVYLFLGWTAPQDRFMALTTAAIVGIAASNGGTTAQDLKTAYLVGGTPWKQQVALFVGVVTSASLIGLTLVVLNNGPTEILPERHPGAKLSEVRDSFRTRKAFSWEANQATLADRGLTTDAVARAAFAGGFLVERQGEEILFTSFDKDANESALAALPLPGGAGTIGGVGAVNPAGSVDFQDGFVRDATQAPVGHYLVDAQGEIAYLVDPGIGGRVSEYAGEKLVRYDAPKARLFSLIIDGILTQQLPWTLVLIGVFIALMLELAGVASLPFAVGVYLPISTSAPIFVGGMVRWLVDRVRGARDGEGHSEFSPGVLLSSGYIAGAALVGVLVQFVTIGFPSFPMLINLPERIGGIFRTLGGGDGSHPLASNLFALVMFSILVALLLRTGLKGESAAISHGDKAD